MFRQLTERIVPLVSVQSYKLFVVSRRVLPSATTRLGLFVQCLLGQIGEIISAIPLFALRQVYSKGLEWFSTERAL